ncbi:DUF413 domain-containing protein [Pasteurellaceae bacterium TAE3-ERU1]|uniref:DUF413 domain-containing protein n=1 Tax=Spirabiliibacterium TaxID=2820724 RepID=UPI001AAD3F9E|nr:MULTISPECIES: DUF413 domain-containing protein [Spirabiliibacterium]MBE2895884.1 DUF413 domain-containing protein [Spirabiliibacterium pneumoniae]MBE2898343.1 DUF413 domain-containing protein [Spirabiliibacterium mucosae]MBV7388095.1 DUF413 domain-containing protein [Pasteurellaceae bacterium TAE3-ERU1]
MAESFSVTRRFFDDKNYPRGFSRHGDYTIRESETLEKYGQAFIELQLGNRKPKTKEEKQFVAVCKKEREPETFFEKTWVKYTSRINSVKRVYTLSGLAAADSAGDDFTE